MTRCHAPQLVSVIVPVGDDVFLPAQLEALSRQDYRGAWELVLCDNRPSGSIEAPRSLEPSNCADVRVVTARRVRGSSHARNVGASVAAGALLAFCDADDVVSPQWLRMLVRAAREVDFVGGSLDATVVNAPDVAAARACRDSSRPIGDWLPIAPSGNFAIWKNVFETIGGFREDYPKAHDEELSYRLQVAGYRFAHEAEAVVHYRYRVNYSAVFRQGVRSGRARAQLYADFRQHGLHGRSLRDVVRSILWLVARAPSALSEPAMRRRWLRRSGEQLGRLIGSARHRVVYP